MPELTYTEIDDHVLDALGPPPLSYYCLIAILGAAVLIASIFWLRQILTGMGLAGINHPVGWAVYITNFVFWIGIAHSGTLISAILYLVRARFRDAISRSAEAMTVFAVMIAAMFPLIHLGRFWVFYYILPYPSQRQIWPNFISPLLWDIIAISTYLTVSVIFFYVGLLPDLAAARDRFSRTLGAQHLRTRFCRALSLGWFGAASQWRHYGRAYLFFAALATPLVVSVHSIVSWDFAMSLLPGWHSPLFPPYFVAGAIHSGLAMVLVFLIPMRKILRLDRMISVYHYERVAQLMLVTTAVIGYAYAAEPFVTWTTGDRTERQFALWRATSWFAWAFWGIILLNVIAPALFAFRKIRRNTKWLLAISICVIAGMWIERYFIIVGSLAHDFLPHNWGTYSPRPVEVVITFGSFCLFLLLFLVFAKSLPTIPLTDYKTETSLQQVHELQPPTRMKPARSVRPGALAIRAVYADIESLLHALGRIRERGFEDLECFTPSRISALQNMMGYRRSHLRWCVLTGGLLGLFSGYALPVFTAGQNQLIVGGKHWLALIPYSIIAFEMTVLFGALANLAGLIFYARLGKKDRPYGFDSRFTQDRFGLVVACSPQHVSAVEEVLAGANVELSRLGEQAHRCTP